ncbi:hypothetical protein CAB90_02100 [Mycobacterium tuberculosis]|uniref:Uncharacterized protein n=1 Tax=Mycobacterium tuberculosis TaxID=1773 RepID=A0A0U0UMT1_MYCTX|nr:hypothetical protein CAB90_02100 [Mycobacterium tuberculosis]CPA37677.1 Uncharacterised protein [Mycobacterium tuberculosis]
MLDGDLRLSVVGVDHDDGRRLMLKNAYRDLLVADNGCDSLRQCLDGT